MRDLSHITSKFYNSEEERLRKMFSKKDVIKRVGEALKPLVQTLYMKRMRFYIFETDEDASPPTIHVGLFCCCNKQKDKEPDPMAIQFVEDEIRNKTIYKNIIWES